MTLGWTLVLGLIAAVSLIWGIWFWRYGDGAWLAARERGTIIALRAGAFLALGLFVLNPGCSEVSPDPDAYYVAVMVDASASMGVNDGQPQSRAERLRRALEIDGQWRARWEAVHQLRFFHFADSLRVGLPDGDPVGRTALGEVVATWPDNLSETRLPSAIVVMTDGQVTAGRSMLDALRQGAFGNVPISFLGLGAENDADDFAITLEDGPGTFAPEEAIAVAATFTNRSNRDQTVLAVFTIDGAVVERRTLAVPEGTSLGATFSVSGQTAGPHLVSVSLADPVPGDTNPANDQASAIVEVRALLEHTVLYLADSVTAEFRPLKLALEERADLELHAVLDFGEEQLWAQGISLPESATSLAAFLATDATWIEHDAIVISAGALARLPNAQRKALRDFVDRRGGGLLVQGGTPLGEGEWEWLPARVPQSTPTVTGRPLELRREPLFDPDDHRALFETPGLRVPESSEVAAWRETALGASAVLLVGGNELPLLWVHRYGGGRVAVFGLSNTAPWRYGSALGQRQHRAFWTGLLTWLAKGGRERLEVQPAVAKIPLRQPVEVTARALDADYSPAPAARVSAEVLSVDGRDFGRFELLPVPDRPGGFAGQWSPPEAGLFELLVRAELPSGETLRQPVYLQAQADPVELADTSLDERSLRDAARLAGGRYASFAEGFPPEALPLSADVPVREHVTEWTRTPFWLSLLFILFAAEWWYRRHKGLL